MDRNIIDKFVNMGLNAFPLKTNSKVPIFTTKHLQTEKYTGKFPHTCNVGVMMGPISNNTFVLDLDDASLMADFSEYKGRTLITETGKGFHIWFRVDTRMPTTKRIDDKRGRHIDFQSTGTYVVIPPSYITPTENKKHEYPKSKQEGYYYEILSDHPIMTVKPEEIQQKLESLGFELKPKSHEEIKKGVSAGNRHHCTFAYACELLRRGIFGAALRKEIEELNQKHQPPMSSRDLDHILKSVLKYEGKNIQRVSEEIDNFEKENTPTHLTMQQIDASYEGKLIEFEALIIACGERKSYVVKANYQCPECHKIVSLKCNEFYEINVPKCKECSQRLELDRNTMQTDYIQRLRVQELLESAKFSSPIGFEGEIIGENVGNAFTGQKKTFTAKFRSIPQKDKYNVIVFEIIEMTDLEQTEGCMPTAEEKQRWNEVGGIFELMRDSIAPELYVDPTIKESLMLTGIGGCSINGKRDISHIALLGDGQTAKSDMLKHFYELIPGSGYVNGSNVSVAGLTIGMVKLHDGTMIPQGGILPTHTGKPVIFDELDKSDKTIHKSLYECMEQGIVSSGKTGTGTGQGIILPAECPILAAGNPIGGKFNPQLENNIMDNFNIEETLMGRFDIIFIVRDKNDPEIDDKIIDTITNYENIKDKLIQTDEIQRYFSYARSIKASIPVEVKDQIRLLFKKMRKINTMTSISIGPRQFLGLNRLVSASAAGHLRTEATMEDFALVERIIKQSFKSLNIDIEEGKVQGTHRKQKNNKEVAFREVWGKCQDEFGMVNEQEFVQALGQTDTFPGFKAVNEFQKYKTAGGVIIDTQMQRWRLVK